MSAAMSKLAIANMSPTRFRALREHLGLSVAYAAEALGVTTRTINRWESGTTALPIEAAAWMQTWVDRTEAHVEWLINDAQTTEYLVELRLYAGQIQYQIARPAGWLTWTWWNRCAARVAAVTGAELTYEPTPALDLTACEHVE